MSSLTRTIRRRRRNKVKKSAIKWYRRMLKERRDANNQRSTQG